MPWQTRRWLLVIWTCFMMRATFYAVAFPLWEGFDEWAHFAVIRRNALLGEVLVSRQSPVPRDVQASLDLAPVPWELRDLPKPAVTEDEYWRLSAEERHRREDLFRALPVAWAREDSMGGLKAYEALQPPLYYWLMAPALRIMAGASLAHQVIWIRCLSVAVGSMTIPLMFLIGRFVFQNDAMALGCAAVVAAMPEFAIDIARVGNECIAVVLFTLWTWMALRFADNRSGYSSALYMGAVLGFGLLTKVYFLTAIAAISILLVYEFWYARAQRRTVIVRALAIILTAVLIAGWWYVRNLLTTGTLSGLNEAVILREASTSGMLWRAPGVHWLSAVDSIIFSHIWFGGWSSLTVRSWMYHVFYAAIVIATVGLLRVRGRRTVWVLAAIYGSFWAGELYNVLLLFLSKGVSTSMGWYMYAVIGAEVALSIVGLASVMPARLRRYVPLIAISLFVLLDLYTIHAIALPYYAGVIAHRPNGSIAALHIADMSRLGFGEIFTRLTAYKTGIVTQRSLLALWGAYLLATGGLVAVGIRSGATGAGDSSLAA